MELALNIPGFGEIQGNTASNFPANNTNIGDLLTSFGEVAILIGGFLMFFWATWGVFDYLRAEGNKEALAKARKRIQWAIIGFIILIMTFFLSNTIRGILNPQDTQLQELKDPRRP